MIGAGTTPSAFAIAQTRDIVQNIYIRKVEKKNGELYNVEFATFEGVKDPGKVSEQK